MKKNQPKHRPHFIEHTANILGRFGQTVGVAGWSALRIARGDKPDAHLLKDTFEQLGTTYIKIGQFIASTPSLFPRDYVEAFQGCLDQTTPVPYAYIEQVLTEEFATDPAGLLEQYFAAIDPNPIASASIAQVHGAVLADGTQVVIKVQKPNVTTIMQTDLGVLHGVSKMLELAMPSLRFASMAPITDEIRTRMLAETDFIAEAANIRDFHRFLNETGNQRVTAPQVIDELTTTRVLTMTRLHGVSMIDEQAMRRYCTDPAQVMADTLNTWFASLLACDSFHADLHAGNLMLLSDGRIGFIDFGIVGVLKADSWHACIGMLQALQVHDYDAMAEHMIDMGMTHERERINPRQLSADLHKVMQQLLAQDQQLNEIKTINPERQVEDLNKMMLEMTEVGKRHGIHFPRDFALLTKQMLYFDRFMRHIAPDMDMFSDQRIVMAR